MQVFRVSLKILKKNIPTLLIYIVIFLIISLLFASFARGQESEYSEFVPVKTSVAFFAEESTPLVEGFKNELAKTAIFVDIEDDYDKIMDALYFRNVSYVLRIPEGFTEKIMSGEEVQLEKRTVPNSTSNIYTDLAINTYFNTARLYVSQEPLLSEEELVKKVSLSLARTTDISIEKGGTSTDTNGFGKFYFNYLAYSLVSILIMGTSIVMLVWKDINLYRRTAISPLESGKINMGKFLALGVFTLITWFVLIISYFFLSGSLATDVKSLLYLVNSLIFAFTALGLSFLIGTLLKNRNAISAVSNVLSLGPSFISGVFVPQELLGESVLSLAKVTPTFWYVTANIRIDALQGLTNEILGQILFNTAIVFAFGIGFFVLAYFLGKRRRFA